MIPAPLLAWFTRPAAKWIVGAVAISLVAIVMTAVLRGEFNKGLKSGRSEVITTVQGETIRQTEAARQAKEKADEEIRNRSIDAIIDGLR